MPFELRMSHDIFQQNIDQTYENGKDAVGVADDVQVFGNEKTHDRNLHEAMECTRKAGIKLNFDKCIIKTNCCSLFGNLYILEGVKPDPRSRSHDTDAANHKQTTSKFFPRYGNLLISIYAKHFFLDIRSEGIAHERCIVSVV